MNIKLPAEFDDVDVGWEPYEVECAGCGITLMCDDANLEEGDRWECWPCAEKFDAEEKAEREARREARIHKMPPGPDRWKERSRTFTGIAEAMAEQWCTITEEHK